MRGVFHRLCVLIFACGLFSFNLAQAQTQTQTSDGTTAPQDRSQSLNTNQDTQRTTGLTDENDDSQGTSEDQDRSQTSDQTRNQNQRKSSQQDNTLAKVRKTPDATTNQPPVVPEIQTEFQKLVFSLGGKETPVFGASLFRNVPTTFAPVDQVPVTADYIVGPGDELRIQLFGQVNRSGRYLVDRAGNVQLPEIGPVHVAGLQYGQLRDALQREFSRVYRNFDLTVQLGDLRSIQVFVVGNVRRPGSFTVSALSTMVNALFASGGPASNGSLRHVQLKRSGEVVDDFDLYDLLLHGDKSKDMRLLPGDVIYVPPVGPQVALLGSVNQTAIYELKDEKTLGDVLSLSGGLTSVASVKAVRIERISEHQALMVKEASLTPEGEATPVQNGDILTFRPIDSAFKNAVTLRGNVANPGRYVWHEGMRLRDLIPNKESLITADYWHNHNNLGLNVTRDYDRTQAGFPVQEGALAVSSSNNSAKQQTTNSTGPTVSSISDAQSTSSSKFSARNDVILSAADIDWNYAVIERLGADNLETSLIPFNLGKLILSSDDSQNLTLQEGDVVTIFSNADIEVPQSQRTRFVRLEGEVMSAGLYSVRPGENLADLVARAGGMTGDAYLFGSAFTRQSTQKLQQQRLNEYVQQLQNQLLHSSINDASRAISAEDATISAASQAASQSAIQRLATLRASGRIVLGIPVNAIGVQSIPNISLEDGDRFIVPRLPSEVNVQGAVFNQNAFLFAQNERAGNYIRRAGGPTRDADPKKAFIIRADGSLVSRQYLSKHQFDNTRIFPGDTVVVPERIDKQSTLRTIGYLSQIIGQIGFSAAAISVLR
jgi:polysaccharide export outer membrane protein